VRNPDAVLPAVIAHSYYMLGKSRIQIADQCGLSRWQVARLLREAQANGTVRVDIRLPLGILDVPSAELTATFGLPVIVVSDIDDPQTSLANRVRHVTVDLLASMLTKDDVVGVVAGPVLTALDNSNTHLGQSTPLQFVRWQQGNGLARHRLGCISKLVVELQRGMELPDHWPKQSLGAAQSEPPSSPTIVGVACGASNSSTVRAAIERRFIHALVTDSSLAECLLAVSHEVSAAIATQRGADNAWTQGADLRRGHRRGGGSRQ
jgi:DNA-binding transcriptional regulator LsrR (DeoR family)